MISREEAIKICKRDLKILKSNKALPDGIEALEKAISDMQKLERIEKFIDEYDDDEDLLPSDYMDTIEQILKGE